MKYICKIIILFLIGISLSSQKTNDSIPELININIPSIEIPSFMNKTAKEGLWEALEYYEIHHKEIVYAQAILETGHFTSKKCVKDNNLFGLRGKNGYYKYEHWTESVEAYKNKIQNRYRDGEDYYKFLTRIRYAEGSNYNLLLKKIV